MSSILVGGCKLWREGEPFSQRPDSVLQRRRNTITRPLGVAEDGTNYKTDFDPHPRRVETERVRSQLVINSAE